MKFTTRKMLAWFVAITSGVVSAETEIGVSLAVNFLGYSLFTWILSHGSDDAA